MSEISLWSFPCCCRLCDRCLPILQAGPHCWRRFLSVSKRSPESSTRNWRGTKTWCRSWKVRCSPSNLWQRGSAHCRGLWAPLSPQSSSKTGCAPRPLRRAWGDGWFGGPAPRTCSLATSRSFCSQRVSCQISQSCHPLRPLQFHQVRFLWFLRGLRRRGRTQSSLPPSAPALRLSIRCCKRETSICRGSHSSIGSYPNLRPIGYTSWFRSNFWLS